MKTNVSRRPGRPKSKEKAQAIKQAAAHLFMADGVERTSMDAIASAAGVSKQTVYSHFNSKDDLFRSCITGKTTAYGLTAGQMPDDSDVDAVLTEIGRRYLTLLCDAGVVAMFRLMASEANTFPKIVRSFYETGPAATFDSVAAVIARHLPGYPENAQPARRATSEFLSLVRGEYVFELIYGIRQGIDAAKIDDHVRRCTKQFRKLYEQHAHIANAFLAGTYIAAVKAGMIDTLISYQPAVRPQQSHLPL